jgi:hypothetical protein
VEHRLAAAGLASRPWFQPPGGGTVTGRALQRAEAASPGPAPLPRADVVQAEVAFANALAAFCITKCRGPMMSVLTKSASPSRMRRARQ